jgi:hypothetical protein
MSFNTLSVTPPPNQQPSQPLLQPISQKQQQLTAPPNLPHPFLNQLTYSQIQSLNTQLQSLFMPQNNTLTNQQINSILNKNLYGAGLGGGFNPPPSSLNNSISYQFASNSFGNQAPSSSAIKTTNYASYLSNPAELSPFNSQQSTNLLGLGNTYNNNSNNPTSSNLFNSVKSFASEQLYNMNLNESFDNVSIFDESFKLNLNTFLANAAGDRNDVSELIKNEEGEHVNDFDEEDDFEEEDEDEEYMLDEYEFLNTNHQRRQNKLSKKLLNNEMNSHHENILKFYEEEEKNIALEIKQDKQLLSVLAEEVKLTRQLSVEKLMHYNHQFQKLKNDLIDEDEHEEHEQSVSF